MKTLGQMLQEKRKSHNLSLEIVEKETKIRRKFLEAIESDNFKTIASQAYAQGFIKNYSEYLGLSSKNMMAFFRRQTREAPRSTILPRGVTEPLNKQRYIVTPTRFLLVLVAILLLFFLGYFGIQYRRLQISPRVVLESPQEGLKTDANRVEIIGKTDADATVTINGIGVLVRSDGKFFDQVQVFPGHNKMSIVVTSRYGKITTIEREVLVEEKK